MIIRNSNSYENFSLLLEAAQNRNQSARDELGVMYMPLIEKIAKGHHYALYLGEDGVGDACEAFTHAMDGFKGSSQKDFENYVCKCIYNHLNRRMKRNFERSQAETLPDEDFQFPEEGYMPEFDRQLIFDVVRPLLSDRQFAVFYPMVTECLTVTEVAERLGVSRKTASQHLNMARERLKAVPLIRELLGGYSM